MASDVKWTLNNLRETPFNEVEQRTMSRLGDGTRTSQISITLVCGDHARLHMPNNTDMQQVLERVEKTDGKESEPVILVLDAQNRPKWMPVGQLKYAMVSPSGSDARLSRPPCTGLLTYAFWLPEGATNKLDERIREAMARHQGDTPAHLLLVTRKRPGWALGGLDVICQSEIATAELGRGCLRPTTALEALQQRV